MDQKRLMLAIAVSLGILLAFQYFYEAPRMQAAQEAQRLEEAAKASAAPVPDGSVPTPGGVPGAGVPGASVAATPADRATLLTRSPRVRIESPRLTGSIALTGARLDDVTLPGYRETVDANSPPITLLHPAGLPDAYYSEGGWVGEKTDLPLPGADTLWQADRQVLRPGEPVTLSWDNGQGLRFSRVYSIDRNYMVTVSQSVANSGSAPVTLFPYSLIARVGTPVTQGYFILHEGVVGVLNDVLQEHTYKDMRGGYNESVKTTGGWLGLTDKYWLVALVPDQANPVTTRVSHQTVAGVERYQLDYLGAGQTVAPGASIQADSRLFVGAKEVKLLRDYRENGGIPRFDYAVDWGWFFFLTRPIFLLLDFIYGMVGNFGISILLLTVVIKALFFPLANKSYAMMNKMKKLGPMMTELREKHGDDKQKMNAELMAVYKREKVNPMSGCLPMVLQIPVFFSLYKVLFVTIEMRQAPFYGWIKDLSQPDPTTVANLFGLIPWTPPEFAMLGAWPLIMGVTMFLQQRLNPQPADPIQAKMFMIMPVMFTFMLAHFPAGLVIYWAWNNTLSMAQQWVIMKRSNAAPSRSPA